MEYINPDVYINPDAKLVEYLTSLSKKDFNRQIKESRRIIQEAKDNHKKKKKREKEMEEKKMNNLFNFFYDY